MFQRGVCHTFNSGQQGHPKLYVTTAGKVQALSLYLDAQPEEYYGPYSYDATGFKILVHDQSELYPNIEDLALDITPGFTTNIRVRRNKVNKVCFKPQSMLLVKLSPPKRNGERTGEVKSKRVEPGEKEDESAQDIDLEKET